MSESCALCGNDLNPYDVGIYTEITAWVSGPKKDGATFRTETGRHAHKHCIEKASQGVAPDTGELF